MGKSDSNAPSLPDTGHRDAEALLPSGRLAPDPLSQPLAHLFSPKLKGVLSTAAVASVLCFVAGVSLLGSSHAAGYLYAASMVLGVPVLVGMRPWQASIPWPVRLHAAAYLALFILFALHVVFRDANTSVLDNAGRLLFGAINGYYFFHLFGRKRDALFTFIVAVAAAHMTVAISYTFYHGISFSTLTLTGERIGGHAERVIPFALLHISSVGIVVLALADRVRPERKFALLAAIALLIAVSLLANIIGRSRGPLLILPWLFILLTVLIWFRLGRAWGIGIFAAGAGAFAAAAAIVFARDPQLWTLLLGFLRGEEGITDIRTSAAIRLELWVATIKLVPEALWFGHGLGSWPDVLGHPRIDPAEAAYLQGFAHPHNEFLNLLLKIGLVGAALFLAPMGVAVAGTRRMMRDPALRLYAFTILWFVGAHLIFGLTDIFTGWTTNTLFFGVFLGMLIWLVPESDEAH